MSFDCIMIEDFIKGRWLRLYATDCMLSIYQLKQF